MSGIARVPFETDRSLINHAFDGYKLSEAGAPLILHEHELAVPLAPAPVDAGEFSFKKLQRRAVHNHLFTNPHDAFALYYVDGEGALTRAAVTSEGIVEQKLFAMGRADKTDVERPTILFPAADLILLSPGDGRLALLRIGGGSVVEAVQLRNGTLLSDGRGIVAHDARLLADGALAVCASAVRVTEHADVAADGTKWKTMFETFYFLLRADAGTLVATPHTTLTSNEAPISALVEPSGEHFLVVGTGTFVGPKASDAIESVDSSAMLVDDQPAAAEASDASGMLTTLPYQWAQTDSDVVVYITLPAPVAKASVACRFERSHVSVKIDGVPVGAFGAAQVFGTLRPADCVWTLEKERLLTLYFEKDDRFRWSHVFVQDDGVAETMDPSELAKIAEHLDRLSSPYIDGDRSRPAFDAKALDRHQEECDTESTTVTVHRFNASGMCTHISTTSGHDWLCLGLAGADGERALGVRLDVDALAFRLAAGPQLQHVASLNAFAYVQASKRLRKYVTFMPDYSAGIVLESTRYLYVYRQPANTKAKEGHQHVVDLDPQGQGVEFFGIAALPMSRLAVINGKRLIVLQL